jgi:hypothetical protein
MEWQQLVISGYEQVARGLGRALDGLSVEELNQQPNPDCNSIGWLAWHISRTQDGAIAGLTGEEQLWVKDGWHVRFNRPADPRETGFGHTPEDVRAFNSPYVETQLGYHQAVLEQTKRCIGGLSAADLDRKLDNPVFPTVGIRLVAVISDNLQHVGQAAYVRGLLQGRGWSKI